MSESPLLKRSRARLAQQRQQAQDRWEVQPAAYRQSLLKWMLRIVAIIMIMILAAYRMGGGRIF